MLHPDRKIKTNQNAKFEMHSSTQVAFDLRPQCDRPSPSPTAARTARRQGDIRVAACTPCQLMRGWLLAWAALHLPASALAAAVASSEYNAAVADVVGKVNLVLLSDRMEAIEATVRSAYASKRYSSSLMWHIFTSLPAHAVKETLVEAGVPAADLHLIDMEGAVESLIRRGVVPVWRWSDWQDWLNAPATEATHWRSEASLIEFPPSREAKHACPAPYASIDQGLTEHDSVSVGTRTR